MIYKILFMYIRAPVSTDSVSTVYRERKKKLKLASILLLAFSLFALFAALSQCLCSESPYL
jgi:accessory gene regulator protein AgrB